MGLFSTIGNTFGAIGGAAKAIQGNQQKQRQKGEIGQSYREDAYQEGLKQANTRQASNESLNARGVLTAGANPGPIGTALQQVAKSGGAKIAGSGVDPFLTVAGAGSVGPANTLAGGQNQQMTDQFALEDLGLAKNKSTAERANQDQYLSTIGSGIAGAFQTAANIATGGAAGAAATAIGGMTPPSGATGAYGMPINPTFFSGGGVPSGAVPQGTIVGDGSSANYAFHG